MAAPAGRCAIGGNGAVCQGRGEVETSDVLTTSSRSVGIVGFGGSLAEAEAMAEEALEFVSGEAIYVRHDIGKQHSLNKRIRHMDEVKSS